MSDMLWLMCTDVEHTYSCYSALMHTPVSIKKIIIITKDVFIITKEIIKSQIWSLKKIIMIIDELCNRLCYNLITIIELIIITKENNYDADELYNELCNIIRTNYFHLKKIIMIINELCNILSSNYLHLRKYDH